MYKNASKQFNTLITAPGRTFRARLLVGDEILEGISSVKLTNGSNNGDALTLGSTISQMATITMENPGFSLSGKEFTLQIGLKIGEDVEYIPMGVFIVDKPEVKADKLSITAYDRMIKLSVGYISSLPDVTDTISVLGEMEQLTGVPISTEGLDTLPMAKPVGYTCRETLMYIAQMYGGFANASRDGIIEIHAWEDTGYILEADMGINGFVAGETYTVNRIACATEQNEDGESVVLSAGEGTGIGITNPFMTQEILDEIYEKIKGFTYDVATCPVILGDPRLESWDIITINSAAGTTHKVPLMVLEYVYDGGLSMTITSTCSTESEESFDYKGPMERLIEQLVSKVGDAEKELYSEIAQTNKSISLMVKKDDLIAQINLSDGVIKLDSNRLIVNSDNFKLSEDGTLEAVNGIFTGTITGSSGEFTEGFSVKLIDTAGCQFKMSMSTSNEILGGFNIEYWADDGYSSLISLATNSVSIGCSHLTGISAGRTLSLTSYQALDLAAYYFNVGHPYDGDADVDIYLANDIYVKNGSVKLFELMSEKGNLTIGKGLYEEGEGDTGLFGNDVYIYAKNSAGTPGGFRPYFGAETVTISIQTAGYVTSSGKIVCFIVPRCKPLAGSGITVSAANVKGFILRQGGKYTHGSANDAYVADCTLSATLYAHGYTLVKATFTDTTNVTNNAPIGVTWNGTLTFT